MSRTFKQKFRARYRKLQPWLIWALAAAFFFVEYFARVDPSVSVTQLMSAFDVGAFAVSSLAAFFYYPYALMQIPVGALVDRYGPHRLLTGAVFLCALGAFSFAAAKDFSLAETSRIIIGFSASFAFVGTLKIATIWFEPRRLGLLAGLTQGMGMLGAAVGEGLFAWVVSNVGWRGAMYIIGGILFTLAILIGLFVRDKRPGLLQYHADVEGHQLSIWEGLKIVFRNQYSWTNALFAGFLYAPTVVFAALWGPSFLHRVYRLSPNVAAIAVSTIFIGWAVGSPVFGWLSDRMARRRPVMLTSAIASLIFMVIILYGPKLPMWLLFVVLICYGIANTGVAISYAVAGEINPLPVAGTSIAFANMVSVLIGALLQPVVGKLIDSGWDGTIVNGARVFSAADFHQAMGLLPLSFVLAIVLVFFIKETYCERI